MRQFFMWADTIQFIFTLWLLYSWVIKCCENNTLKARLAMHEAKDFINDHAWKRVDPNHLGQHDTDACMECAIYEIWKKDSKHEKE